MAIRGDAKNLGEVAPPRFLRVLSEGPREEFGNGSGRRRWRWPRPSRRPKTPSRRESWSTASGNNISAGASCPLPATSANLASGLRIPSCSTTWRQGSSTVAGRSKPCIAKSCCRRLTGLAPGISIETTRRTLTTAFSGAPTCVSNGCRIPARRDAGRCRQSRHQAGRPARASDRRQPAAGGLHQDQPHETRPHDDVVRLPRPENQRSGPEFDIGASASALFLEQQLCPAAGAGFGGKTAARGGRERRSEDRACVQAALLAIPGNAEIAQALEFLGADEGDWPKYTQCCWPRRSSHR